MKYCPKVCIVIVNWNGQRFLEECLTSIRDCTDYPNFKVVVVDNGSNDGSVEMTRRDFPWVKLIKKRVNLGFAKANNIAIKHALMMSADYIFLLNNDTKMIHRDWLTRMIEVAETNQTNGIIGCKLIFPDGRLQHAGGLITVRDVGGHRGGGERDDGTYDKITEAYYVTGAAFMIKKEVVRKIGLFDEDFSPAYYEETDYCARARVSGYKVIYNPKTTITHYEGVSTEKRFSKLEREYVQHKNRLRFMLLNFPIEWLLMRIKYELTLIIGSFFQRKDRTRRLTPTNAMLCKDWYLRLVLLFKAYLENIRGLNDIIQKRMYRTARIWD